MSSDTGNMGIENGMGNGGIIREIHVIYGTFQEVAPLNREGGSLPWVINKFNSQFHEKSV